MKPEPEERASRPWLFRVLGVRGSTLFGARVQYGIYKFETYCVSGRLPSGYEGQKTLVHEEKFQDFSDFSANAFRVTIGRCQQVALDKAGGKLPLPAEQLALINKHREKKNARLATAKPISIDVLV